MTVRTASELLYDSEAALRLVDSAIAEMRDVGAARPGSRAGAPGDATTRDLSEVLARGYGEIVSVLGSVRASRSVLDELRTTLRDERGSALARAEAHDVATRQLNYASSVLAEMETRLAELARIFDPEALGTVAR